MDPCFKLRYQVYVRSVSEFENIRRHNSPSRAKGPIESMKRAMCSLMFLFHPSNSWKLELYTRRGMVWCYWGSDWDKLLLRKPFLFLAVPRPLLLLGWQSISTLAMLAGHNAADKLSRLGVTPWANSSRTGSTTGWAGVQLELGSKPVLLGSEQVAENLLDRCQDRWVLRDDISFRLCYWCRLNYGIADAGEAGWTTEARGAGSSCCVCGGDVASWWLETLSSTAWLRTFLNSHAILVEWICWKENAGKYYKFEGSPPQRSHQKCILAYVENEEHLGYNSDWKLQ